MSKIHVNSVKLSKFCQIIKKWCKVSQIKMKNVRFYSGSNKNSKKKSKKKTSEKSSNNQDNGQKNDNRFSVYVPANNIPVIPLDIDQVIKSLQERNEPLTRAIHESFASYIDTINSQNLVTTATLSQIESNLDQISSGFKSATLNPFVHLIITESPEKILEFTKDKTADSYFKPEQTHSIAVLVQFLRKSLQLISESNENFAAWILAAINDIPNENVNGNITLLNKILKKAEPLSTSNWKKVTDAIRSKVSVENNTI